MSTTFCVAVKLRGVADPRKDDPRSHKLIGVLSSITTDSVAADSGYHLAGGGGYGNPEFTGECVDVACLLLQKNQNGSGDLIDCDESDRARVREVLREHPHVERFHIGALHHGVDYDAGENARVTAALVADFVRETMGS